MDGAKRLLVVDDNPEILEIFSGFLTRNNFVVSTAGTGEGALKLIQAEPFDLVLLDINLPGIDGLEVLRKIKEFDQSIRVIMLTGYGYDLSKTNSAIEGGASAYIAKSLSLDEVLLSIEDAFLQEPRKAKITQNVEPVALNEAKVLIVDDEKDFRTMLIDYLKMLNMPADVAATAEEALQKLKIDHFDLVLLDVKMPGMGGLEGLREICKNYPRTKVIVATAVKDDETMSEMNSLGAAGFLIKPFYLEQLKANILLALSKRKQD